MAYQTPITIKSALDQIWRNEIVLPAIQREFVWPPEKIRLFYDSLMQGFPVGSFLFWKIERETTERFRFFGFVRDYHQRNNPHCPPLGKAPEGRITAALDGQQRLTALNIGLRGSMAVKEPNKWWNNPNAFPVKRLYLDLGCEREPDEQGVRYRFEFLTEERAGQPRDGELWFLVSDVFGMTTAYDVIKYLAARELGANETAVAILSRLHAVVHVDPVIAFYEENSQDIEKVLNIFIRTNSGGIVLSYSDLLLSIATAQWDKRDARSEIHGLVDELNDIRGGFNFSKDFVLKAGLMLSDIASVGFKVENFNRANMRTLEANWPAIAETLKLTVELAGSFGLSRDTIRADSALLPIAYYLHRRQAGRSFLTSSGSAEERATIKRWLIRSLIKPGVWGSALDVLLTALRDVLRKNDSGGFPVEALEREMRARGKTLEFTEEEIEDLADTEYGKRDLLGLMILLFPFVDTANNQFHIDHVYPRAMFHARRLQRLGYSAEEIAELQAMKERMANLQLLQGQLNQAKSDQMPGDWMAAAFASDTARADYVARHMIEGAEADMSGFRDFYTRRRSRLIEALRTTLNG
jgi:hypothetical protein